MKKLLIIALVLCSIVARAQKKTEEWEKAGFSQWKDTITHDYILKNKDSLKFEIETEKCHCLFYTKIGSEIKTPCKNMQRHHMITWFMTWQKSITTCKDKIIRTEKPHWEINSGTASTIDGSFEINGKFIQPSKLFYKDRTTVIYDSQ